MYSDRGLFYYWSARTKHERLGALSKLKESEMARYFFIVACFFATSCGVIKKHQLVCSDSKAISTAKLSRKTVSLQERPQTPVFYVNENDKGFSILMRPEVVLAHLKKSVEKYNGRADRALLQEVEKDMPLDQPVDLYKYGVSDSSLLSRAEFIVGALLESGQASVIDLWDSEHSLNEVSVVDIKYWGHAQEFCMPEGRSIFLVIHEIED